MGVMLSSTLCSRDMEPTSTTRRSTMRESGVPISGVGGAECTMLMDQCMKENG